MKRQYKYSSGHSKRLKKEKREKQEKILFGSMDKFCLKTGQNNDLENSKSSSVETTELGINEINEAEPDISECTASTSSLKSSSINDSLPSTSDKSSSASLIDNSESLENNTSDTSFSFHAYTEDPAYWSNICDDFRDYFIIHPPKQNIDKLHLTEKIIGNIKRNLTEKHFFRITKSGEQLKRDWLILSLSNFSVYCYVCKLFSTCETALSSSGFSDWKHASERLSEHENSVPHRKAICSLASRMNASQRIDSQLVTQYETECKYWQGVLTRVVAVVKHLARRGLSFYGDDETIGSPNNGNFLGCLELLAEFDPFIAKHLQNFGNCGKGNANYLSSSVVNEFISLMAEKVSKKIVSEIHLSKYFSIIIDSTPDISHTDQLSFVVRYVDSSSRPVERFLTFIPIKHHNSKYLAETVFSTAEKYNLDILNVRGQSYDNASNMSGKYTGLQARIKEINPLAEFVPCSAHTLNLVAVHSVESCTQVIGFFSLLQELYNFFAASTHRWNMLKEECMKHSKVFTSLKSHSSTRWCADADATKSVRMNYREIITLLIKLSKSADESAFTKNEASSLLRKLKKLETAVNIVVWDAILQRLNKASKQLQSQDSNLECVLPLFKSLISFVEYVRENFDVYEQEAKTINPDADYLNTRKKTVPKSRLLDDGKTPQVSFSPRDSFKIKCHYAMCDSLITQLTSRKVSYETIFDKFSFLLNDTDEAFSKAQSLQQHYNVDIDEEFAAEYVQFLCMKQKGDSIGDAFLNLHRLNLKSTFPNVETAFKIFLTLPISNCTSERSFSLLKRLKSPSRNTLSQEKLSALAVLSFENDITSNLDYNDIISEFAAQKVRKRPM